MSIRPRKVERQIQSLTRLTLALLLTGAVSVVLLADMPVIAQQLGDRRIRVHEPYPGLTSRYEVGFTASSNSQFGTIEIEFCSNDPFPNTTCVPPAGFDISQATLEAQSGETGFTVHGSTSSNVMVLSRPAVGPTYNTANYIFDGVVNPDVGPQSYFIRVTTFSASAGAGVRVDEGGYVFSIHGGVGVTAFVPPYLTFCVAISIPTNECSSGVGNTIDFGELSPLSTSSGVSQMLAATNGNDGYVINVLGTTMTAGNKTISANLTPTPALPGVNQFGLNLRANAQPPNGQNPSGPGIGQAFAGYGSANLFKFVSGDQVAGVYEPSDITKFTSTYIVNIDPLQSGGVYSSTLSFIATAGF